MRLASGPLVSSDRKGGRDLALLVATFVSTRPQGDCKCIIRLENVTPDGKVKPWKYGDVHSVEGTANLPLSEIRQGYFQRGNATTPSEYARRNALDPEMVWRPVFTANADAMPAEAVTRVMCFAERINLPPKYIDIIWRVIAPSQEACRLAARSFDPDSRKYRKLSIPHMQDLFSALMQVEYSTVKKIWPNSPEQGIYNDIYDMDAAAKTPEAKRRLWEKLCFVAHSSGFSNPNLADDLHKLLPESLWPSNVDAQKLKRATRSLSPGSDRSSSSRRHRNRSQPASDPGTIRPRNNNPRPPRCDLPPAHQERHSPLLPPRRRPSPEDYSSDGGDNWESRERDWSPPRRLPYQPSIRSRSPDTIASSDIPDDRDLPPSEIEPFEDEYEEDDESEPSLSRVPVTRRPPAIFEGNNDPWKRGAVNTRLMEKTLPQEVKSDPGAPGSKAVKNRRGTQSEPSIGDNLSDDGTDRLRKRLEKLPPGIGEFGSYATGKCLPLTGSGSLERKKRETPTTPRIVEEDDDEDDYPPVSRLPPVSRPPPRPMVPKLIVPTSSRDRSPSPPEVGFLRRMDPPSQRRGIQVDEYEEDEECYVEEEVTAPTDCFRPDAPDHPVVNRQLYGDDLPPPDRLRRDPRETLTRYSDEDDEDEVDLPLRRLPYDEDDDDDQEVDLGHDYRERPVKRQVDEFLQGKDYDAEEMTDPIQSGLVEDLMSEIRGDRLFQKGRRENRTRNLPTPTEDLPRPPLPPKPRTALK